MSGNQSVQTKQANEPFVRMVKLETVSQRYGCLVRIIAVVGSLLTGGLLILFLGHNPLAVYFDMLKGSVGNPIALQETIRLSIPLLVTGLGIGLAFRMRFWNIGAEGQIIMGATAASYFALFWDTMPTVLVLIIMFVVSLLAGGIWGMIPAIFKSRWGTNETLFTLMLNYIALEFLRYLQFGPWKDPAQMGFPKIAVFDPAIRLPKVFGVQAGWIIALILVVAVYIYINKSKQGYEITVVGESIPSATYAGMNVRKIIVRTMFLSGAVCGLTGYIIVAGSNFTLSETVTGGVGFTAITVAWLANLNPVGMVVISMFLAILEKGSNTIQTNYKIPLSAAEILTGLILFFLLACEFFLRYKLVFRQRKEQSHE